MEKPEPDQPESIVVSRRGLDALLMASLLIACLTVSAVVIAIFVRDLRAAPSLLGALFLGFGAPCLLAGCLYVAVYWSRIASQSEFGGAIEMRTLFGRRRYGWTQLGRLVLREQSGPRPSRFIVKMVFTDGRRYVVFANREQGEALFQLAEQQPRNQEWAGAPLPTTMAATFIGLGIVAIFLGILIICDPLADVVRKGLAGNWAAVSEEDVGGLVLAAVVVPLAGLAGIGVGGYHLIRRPIVIRPGVVRLREGEPESQTELL